ncbi:TPA: 3-deoxy-D-manno-octulosonic acid transferase [Legionella pneumophila]|uniref:3-deoxy-D-manno-octulosonic acid transferase n=2 Tax=Legionella pneumophila TaxID=446 RepID=A0A2S6EX79_LEGPN|nr:3-deoxy-D-manno-octulosonic acid transferase [Legionella pneumophila]RYB38917.1 3-deoxy-D-manno-octulosonic acid transferase [Legionella pneumophila]RYW28158.1 3-deoxy-D-manno-octulosonic acid transferase [Legionella pneumophila]TIH02514.1 3-deoxy-D-manno-octulosonic acid transferase [Legionella pneumophila]HAT6809349.1 3-deoxy-D-manno-octulosonic acid transferase [Legionella pneumophila]
MFMRFVYSFLMYLLTPYLFFRLWWKGRKLPAYRQRIAERFCLGLQEYAPVDVWVHAVSLGEVIAATPLIDAMLDKRWSVLVTTMTPTGSERVKSRFGHKVAHQYLPYDLPWVLKRFFKKTRPRVGIIMETELWPNLINQAHASGVSLFLANGRLSDRSLQGYLKLKYLFKPVLNQFSGILTQSNEDAERFIALGANAALVHVLGNMKFDLQINSVDSKKYRELKSHWGEDRVTVIAASTHDNEESQILSQLPRLQEAIPGVVLLIAPRHPERFQSVYQLSVQAGFNTGCRSNLDTVSRKNEVVILDSLGELLGFYQISDFAFVGGSLVPVGGHNVLEPIAMNVPVLSGNQVHNFKTICRELKEAQAILLVNHVNELVDAIIKLYQDKESQSTMVTNASSVLESNKGSVLRYLQKIEAALG